MPDLSSETWGETRKLIGALGNNAATEAAMRADRALDEGDLEAFHKW